MLYLNLKIVNIEFSCPLGRFLNYAPFICILIDSPFLFYFLPFAIAFNKKRANTGAIFALNLFLGWPLIG